MTKLKEEKNATKLKKINCDKYYKLKFRQKSDTKIVTKVRNQICEKIQKIKFLQT